MGGTITGNYDLLSGFSHYHFVNSIIMSLLFSRPRLSVVGYLVVADSSCIFPVVFLSKNTKISEIADNAAEVRYTRL